MKLHGNARTCPNSRKLLVERILEQSWSLTEAAEAAGVSERTARKWVARFDAEGAAGLVDRSSAPKRVPNRTTPERVEAITALRKLRTAAEIAEALGMALSTVSLWLKRVGLGKRSRLDPVEPPNRYERRRPGELVHVDVKKLGRFGVPGKRVVGDRRSSRGSRSASQSLFDLPPATPALPLRGRAPARSSSWRSLLRVIEGR
jgi:transposase